CFAVAVELADPIQRSSDLAHSVDRTRRGDRETVHQVDVVLPGSRVAPQDVRAAVTAEVEARRNPGRRAVYGVDRAAIEARDIQLARLVLAERTDAARPIDEGERSPVLGCSGGPHV